ncbi:hypothetical protein SCLARK_001511 [Spiroplasma clarkii]|nr:hypothetical protein SCLARK_001511 [Spiroplasma clarkii]
MITKKFNLVKEMRVESRVGFEEIDYSNHRIYMTPELIIDFKKIAVKYPYVFERMTVAFDLTGSLVDIYHNKLDLDQPVVLVTYSDFEHQDPGEWSTITIGTVRSQVNEDFIEGKYSLRYKYFAYNQRLVFNVMLESKAFNNGNKNLVTAGKGTNRLVLKCVNIYCGSYK